MTLQAKTLAELMSVSRAGAKTVMDATGRLVGLAADTPAFDHATGRRGLLLELGATNVVRRSSHTAGWPWDVNTTNNGITAELVATGTAGDVPYADYRLSGTNTADYAAPFFSAASSLTAAPAAIGETWSASIHAELVGGAWPAGVMVRAAMNETLAGVYHTGTAKPGSFSWADRRYVETRRVTGGDGVRTAVLLSNMGPAGATSFEGQVIRLYGLQLERAAVATSLIQTLGNAIGTRAADVPGTIDLGAFDLSAGYTLVVAGRVNLPEGAADRIVQMDRGTEGDRLSLILDGSSGSLAMSTVVDGGAVATMTAAMGIGADFSLAASVDASAMRLAVNGVTTNGAAAAFPLPTLLRLGGGAGGGDRPASMTLYWLSLYPRGFSEAEMNEVTA